MLINTSIVKSVRLIDAESPSVKRVTFSLPNTCNKAEEKGALER
jgi:hypothetical protein